MTDTELLRKVIEESGYRIHWIANKIGMSYQGLLNKINGINEFKQSEIVALCDLLELSNEKKDRIFFASNVGK